MKTKLITITLVSLAAVLVTVPFFTAQAYFSDTETSPDSLIVEFEKTPLFNEANFAPGDGVSRWIKVTNNSGQTQRIAVEAINVSNSDNLGDALILKIKEGQNERYTNDLSRFFDAGEVYLSDLPNGATVIYNFSVSFWPKAGNTFQGKSLGFDILVGFQGTEGGLPPGFGGGLPTGLTIGDESQLYMEFTGVAITWTTSYPATIQVIYSRYDEPHTLDLTKPNYGYSLATIEDTSKVTFHSVTITGLTPGTTYFYRVVSYVALSPSSVFSGYFSDTETNVGNIFYAGTLDFSLNSPPDFSPVIMPNATSSRDISVLNDGILDFQYTVQTANAIGSLCNYLSLAADLDGNNKYNGPLTSFNYNVGEFSAPEDWIFAVSLTNNDAGLQNRTCTFDFIYNGTQISGAGFSDVETISNTVTAGTWEVPRIFPDKAVELAKEVIEAPYLWGGKGYDFGETKFATSLNIKESGYYYWDPNEQKIDFGKGLDCAGVSFWGYNRAYYKDQIANWGKCAVYGHECPIGWEGANEQCIYNIEDNAGKYCQYKELNKDQLRPGDLLFFDAEIRKNGKFVRYGQDGVVDHVAMYMGPSWYEGKYYDVIEATIWKNKIITTTVDAIIERIRNLAGEKAFVRSGHVIETKKPEMKIIAHSPVDLIITDPTGIILTQEEKETIGMSYYEYDIDEDGKLDDIINIAIREIGDYLIQVVPHPDALPTDTYSLTVEALVNGETVTVVLTENIPISEIPRAPYILSSTETEIIPIIPAFIDFDPDTLNLKSQGEFVTTYIELPEGYEIDQIDIPSIMLNDLVLALTKPTEIGDYDNDGTFDLMVKFDRSGVQSILSLGDEVNLTLTGKVFYNGNYIDFKGSDVIRVINSNKGGG